MPSMPKSNICNLKWSILWFQIKNTNTLKTLPMIFSWKFWFQPFRPGRFRFDSSIWTLFGNLNLIFRSNKIWFEFDLKKLKSRTISKCDVLELVTSVVTIGGHAGWHIQKAESISVWIFCIIENVDFFFPREIWIFFSSNRNRPNNIIRVQGSKLRGGDGFSKSLGGPP